MKIATINGVGISDIQIETPIQKISLSLSHADRVKTESIFISLTLVDPVNGNKYLIPNMTLRQLLYLNSVNEGIFIDRISFVAGSISISNDGSLVLTNGSYLSLEIKGDLLGVSGNVYGIETPSIVNSVIMYDNVVVQESGKEVVIKDHYAVYFNDPGILDKIEMFYPNSGKSVSYSAEELDLLQLECNESFRQTETGVTSGYGLGILTFGVPSVSKMKIFPQSGERVELWLAKDVEIIKTK